MTIEEAKIIHDSWINYMEIASKFAALMLPVPESFLPYPADTIEKALTIIAKEFLNRGDKEASEKLLDNMSFFLLPFFTDKKDGVSSDEHAITMMKKMLDMMEGNPDLKKSLLKKLKECQESWIKSRSISSITNE